MSSNTTNLNLYKADPVADGNNTFNIKTILNDNWDKIDTAVAGKEPVIATKNTAFNQNFETSATNIKMNGTQSVGTSNNVARADHVHPTDTTKANVASPTFTGTPAAPTPAADTNTTQVATTAFVLGQAGTTTPQMDGTGAIGTSNKYARADHVHPSDTTKANLASPTFTGTPAAPTPAADTNTTQVATTAFVLGQAGATTPQMDGTGAIGTSSRYARADHVHPSDTTKTNNSELAQLLQGNRNINLINGGQLTWGVPANTFTWSKTMSIFPAGGKLLQGGATITSINIAAGSATLANTNDCMYITIPATDGATATVSVGQYNTITGNDKLILAVRDSDSCLELLGGGWLVYGDTVTAGGTRNVYVNKSSFTAANDFLVGTGASSYAKKSLSETQNILGINNVTNESKATMFTNSTFTGTPTAPTPAADTNTTQIATTAFVLGQAGTTTPQMDGTGATGTSNKYARADHVHPSDTSKANNIDNSRTTSAKDVTGAINELNTQLSGIGNTVKNVDTTIPNLTYGMNSKITLTGSTNAAPKFTIQGKTVINLLGKDGNSENPGKWNFSIPPSYDTSNKVFGSGCISIALSVPTTEGGMYNALSKYNVDTSKYYLFSAYLKNRNATGMYITKDATSGGTVVSSTMVTNTSNFIRVGIVLKPSDLNINNNIKVLVNGASNSGQYGYIDGVMLNEITASEYALGADALLPNYPYVDSYACLQNPYIEVNHNNLINKNIRTYASSSINTRVSLGTVKVKSNTFYYFTGTISDATSYFHLFSPKSDGSLNQLQGSPGASMSGAILTGDYGFIDIGVILISPSGNYGSNATLSNMMLIEGHTAPPTYLLGSQESVVLETTLTSDDSITYNNGEVTGQIWWKHKILYGKDYDWQFNTDYTGYKGIKLLVSDSTAGIDNFKVVKYDGKILKYDNSLLSADTTTISNNGGYNHIAISDSETGWTESINPNNDEVKAFMNGWKAISYNNSRYTGWYSIVDGSLPSIAITTTTTASGTSTTSVPVSDSSKFAVNDWVVVGSSGSYLWSYISAIPDGTHITLGASITFASGVYVSKCDNGGTLTNLITWCKNNTAPNYDGYQLHYKLATPEPITDDNCPIHGDIPLFDAGDNYLYLDSGRALGEIGNTYSDGTNYNINNMNYPTALKYKADSILSIYKNGCNDANWYIQNGMITKLGALAQVSISNFDTNATYTVDYKILANLAPQVGTINCSYNQDMTATINKVQEEIHSRQVHDSILDQIVDSSLYETFSQIRTKEWHIVSGTLYVYFRIKLSPKKAKPIISIGSSTFAINGTQYSFNIYLPNYSVSNNEVLIGYSSTDANAINNIRQYGIDCVLCNVIADCRGRI